MTADIGRPVFLPRRQVLYLDAIEESFHMVSLAYARLRQSLLIWGPPSGNAASDPDWPEKASSLNTTILLDAWSLVDVLNRLRVMVSLMPGLRKSSPGAKSFIRSLEPIEALRNAVQHLYGEVDQIASTGHPIWGSLSWAVPQPDGSVRVGVFVPGTLAPAKGIPAVNPVGRKIEVPVGLIALTAGGETVSLSEMVYSVARFADRLHRSTEAAFADHQEGRPIIFNIEVS